MLKYQNHNLQFGLSPKQLDTTLSQSPDQPYYIYDLNFVRHRAKLMRREAPQAEIFYAVKANSNPSLLRILSEEGLGADVVSGGEIQRALQCGFTPSRILYSGVGKTRSELKLAISLGIRQINVESYEELQRIASVSTELQKRANIGLRVNPDVDAKTHPYIATGLTENKFGIDLDSLDKCLEFINSKKDCFHLQGMSLHIGSQILRLESFIEATEKSKTIANKFAANGFKIETFDGGGGVGIFYDHFDLKKEESLMIEYLDLMKKCASQWGATLFLEPGRWLVGHSGVLIAKIEYVKKTNRKNFIVLNTGIHHFIRPALYGAQHLIFPLKEGTGSKVKYDIVGPVCESSDVFARNIEMSEVNEGDYVAIASTGAYGFVMASQYNLFSLPNEFFL